MADPIKPWRRKSSESKGRRLPKALPRPLWDRILEVAAADRREELLAVRDQAIAGLMFASGLRSFELVALDVEDLDFYNRAVHVWHGKGDKERIPAVAKLGLDLVEKYLAVRPECVVQEAECPQCGRRKADLTGPATCARCTKEFDAVPRPHRPLFVSRKSGRMDTSAVRRLFGRVEAVLHAEGVREAIHPHATRHSHITETARNAIRRGKTLFDVAEQAGHSDLNTTRLYYAALAEDRQDLVDDL